MRVAAIVTALLIGAIIVGLALTRPSASEREQDPDASQMLRQKVLNREIFAGVPGATPNAIRAVVYDWQLGTATATLVAFDDGTTSLYFSTGGGVIGAGAHDAVKRAAASFREKAATVRGQFTSASEFPLPPEDMSVFYLVTDSATLTSGPIPNADLQGEQHPFGALARRAQDVIAEVRKSS